MRILYIDVNITHINPTANLFSKMLLNISDDVTFYGPGFLSNEIIKNGVLKFVKNQKPFDIVIYGPTCPMLNKTMEEDIVGYCKNSTTSKISLDTLLKYFKDVNFNFEQIPPRLENFQEKKYQFHIFNTLYLNDVSNKKFSYLINSRDQNPLKKKDF